jgi:hypothetical protein
MTRDQRICLERLRLHHDGLERFIDELKQRDDLAASDLSRLAMRLCDVIDFNLKFHEAPED